MSNFQEQLMALKTEMIKEGNNNKIIETKEIVHSNNANKGVTINTINYDNRPTYKVENNIDLKDIKRGEILYVDIDRHGVGSEQAGIRYSVCLQNDIGNRFSPTIIVAFITSKLTKAKLPIHVEIPKEKFGLPLDSVVLLEQVRTLDKRRIIKRVGTLDDIMMYKIDKALGTSLGVKIAEVEKEKVKIETPLDKLSFELRNKIDEMLDDIHTYEKAISKSRNEKLINHLLGEREAFLLSLQKFCEDNKLNYKDYYIMYSKSNEEVKVI